MGAFFLFVFVAQSATRAGRPQYGNGKIPVSSAATPFYKRGIFVG
jgi:hypothetical protein